MQWIGESQYESINILHSMTLTMAAYNTQLSTERKVNEINCLSVLHDYMLEIIFPSQSQVGIGFDRAEVLIC